MQQKMGKKTMSFRSDIDAREIVTRALNDLYFLSVTDPRKAGELRTSYLITVKVDELDADGALVE